MTRSEVEKAQAHLATHTRGMHHAFVADPHVQTTAGGRAIVRLQQHYAGIPLFGGDLSVHLVDGEVAEVLGEVVDREPAGDGTPDLSSTEAVIAALAHFRSKADRAMCVVRHPSLRGKTMPVPSSVASFPSPSRPTVFRLGRTGSSPAAYLAYRLDGEMLRLVWVVRTPFRAESYLVLIDAEGPEPGKVLLCTRWSSGARCFGSVFSFNHAAGPQRIEFPIPTSEFPPLLPHPNRAHLGPWVEDGTAGNNAVTFDGNTETIVKANLVGGVLEFPAFAPTSKQQLLLNAFFYCNFLHDFFLLLGFGEAEGNFQLKNFSTAKGGNDRLHVRVFDKKNPRLGDMEARDDGSTAKLSLGRAPSGEPTAVHAELVIHEYTHGVIHRMVGGRLATAWLVAPQSQAMDEGWADYFAITIRNHYLGTATNYRFADWAGIAARSASYDPAVARDYGRLGKKPHHNVNGAGEIFAAALIRFNEFLGNKINDRARGHCIGWRAVIESLRLITDNPNFLQGREALIGGIGELERGAVITAAEATHARAAAREAFARYGMGRNAQSAGAGFGGTTSDFNV